MSEVHILLVTNPDNGEKLRLYFSSSEAYHNTKVALARLGYHLNGVGGCRLFSSTSKAMESVQAFVPRAGLTDLDYKVLP
jgi:hypothetical protein